jgi:hypothetical protein
MTAARITELVDALIQSGSVDEDGNIILTQHDGTENIIGQIPVSVSPGELTSILASYATTAAVTSAISAALASYVTSSALTSTLASYATTSAVTSALASYSTTTAMNSAISSAISTALASYSTTSAMNTAIGNPVVSSTIDSSRNLINTRKDTTTATVGNIPGMYLYNGSAYALASTNVYVGNTAPTSPVNGAVWFDTT